MSILHNTTVYGDIKIYRGNVKTSHFPEKLRSASALLVTLQLGNQATDHFHFFTAVQLIIDIPISSLILILIKCGMCRVSLSRSHIIIHIYQDHVFTLAYHTLHTHGLSLSPSLCSNGLPPIYTQYFALGMQLPPAPQSPFSFHLRCGYAQKKKEKNIKIPLALIDQTL